MTMQRVFAAERKPSFSCQKYTTLNRKASIAVIKKKEKKNSVPLWIGVNRIRDCRAKLFRFLFLGIRPRLQAAEPAAAMFRAPARSFCNISTHLLPLLQSQACLLFQPEHDPYQHSHPPLAGYRGSGGC